MTAATGTRTPAVRGYPALGRARPCGSGPADVARARCERYGDGGPLSARWVGHMCTRGRALHRLEWMTRSLGSWRTGVALPGAPCGGRMVRRWAEEWEGGRWARDGVGWARRPLHARQPRRPPVSLSVGCTERPPSSANAGKHTAPGPLSEGDGESQGRSSEPCTGSSQRSLFFRRTVFFLGLASSSVQVRKHWISRSLPIALANQRSRKDSPLWSNAAPRCQRGAAFDQRVCHDRS